MCYKIFLFITYIEFAAWFNCFCVDTDGFGSFTIFAAFNIDEFGSFGTIAAFNKYEFGVANDIAPCCNSFLFTVSFPGIDDDELDEAEFDVFRAFVSFNTAEFGVADDVAPPFN